MAPLWQHRNKKANWLKTSKFILYLNKKAVFWGGGIHTDLNFKEQLVVIPFLFTYSSKIILWKCKLQCALQPFCEKWDQSLSRETGKQENLRFLTLNIEKCSLPFDWNLYGVLQTTQRRQSAEVREETPRKPLGSPSRAASTPTRTGLSENRYDGNWCSCWYANYVNWMRRWSLASLQWSSSTDYRPFAGIPCGRLPVCHRCPNKELWPVII